MPSLRGAGVSPSFPHEKGRARNEQDHAPAGDDARGADSGERGVLAAKRFAPAKHYPMGVDPTGTTKGDFDGDADLATANHSVSVSGS